MGVTQGGRGFESNLHFQINPSDGRREQLGLWRGNDRNFPGSKRNVWKKEKADLKKQMAGDPCLGTGLVTELT